MTEATRTECPDVDALADCLAQGRLSGEKAEEAWDLLQTTVVLPMIQKLEENLACDTLGTAADLRLRKRLERYRCVKGRFSRWLERTLRHMALDELRKRQRQNVFGMDDPTQLADQRHDDADSAGPSLGERLELSLANLRVTLDELDQRPRARQQKTDYHAILLLDLRLAMAARLRGHRETLADHDQTRATIAAGRLIWTVSEGEREIQPGWPRLQSIWEVLADDLARTDELLTDDDLVRLLVPQPGVIGLTSVAWRQWRTRATQAASEYLGAERWDRTVAGWL